MSRLFVCPSVQFLHRYPIAADTSGIVLRIGCLRFAAEPAAVGCLVNVRNGQQGMSLFHIDCELSYDVTQQTVFLLDILVPDTIDQHVIAESLTTSPPLFAEYLYDQWALNRLLRIDAPAGRLNVRYLANVEVEREGTDPEAAELPVAGLPSDVLPYLLSTRYCEADLLFPLAMRKFGTLAPGSQRVESVCQWIRDNVDYLIGTSPPHATARDTLAGRAGVCRDFAHLAISFCRALNIPARFVTGYARYADPPADFHALFEAYLGGRWELFDPTRLSPVEDLVRIGTGRDASEVAFSTFFGAAKLRRLSPLVEAMRSRHPRDALIELQSPGSGIQLAA